MSARRIALLSVFVLSLAVPAFADTVRVVVDRALVWTQPGGVSIVMSQLLRGQTAEVVRRVGDWYEIIAPPGSGGADRRTGFIAATQVVLESGGSTSGQASTPGRQTSPRPPRPIQQRSRVLSVDGGFRVGVDEFTRSFSAFTDRFAEAGTIATNFGKASGFVFSVLFAERVEGSFGVGLAADYYTSRQTASVEAHVPHPFFFNQLRDGSFETDGLNAHEAAFHIPAVWMPAPRGSLGLLVYGGPTFFRVSHTVVTDVKLDEQYPYDTVHIAGVVTEERKNTLFGFHVGGDVSYMFNRQLGVGGGVRYSRATLKFKNDDDVTMAGTAGGATALAGLRFRF